MNIDIELSHKDFHTSTEHQITIGQKILNYIFAINAGGILAFVGFLSHKSYDCELTGPWFWGVISYLMGIIFVLISKAFAYFQQMALTGKYRNENYYYRELENYNNMLSTYNQMKNDPTITKESLENQYSVINQLYESMEKRRKIINMPFSNYRLWWAIFIATISVLSFVVGTILILCGFE